MLDLRAKSKFVSDSEKDRAETEKRAQMKSKNTYFDALRRSNRPISVLLSPAMRKMLEDALGIRSTLASSKCAGDFDYADDELDFEARLVDVYADIESTDIEFIPSSVGLSGEVQANIARNLVEYLSKLGFSKPAILSCLVALLSGDDACGVQDRFESLPLDDKSSTTAVFGVLKDSSLQYMCLNIEEADLPKGFDPSTNEGRIGFQVFARLPAKSDVVGVVHVGIDTMIAQDLMKYGWNVDICATVCARARNVIHCCLGQHHSTDLPIVYYCTAYLLQRYEMLTRQQRQVSGKSLSSSSSSSSSSLSSSLKKAERDLGNHLRFLGTSTTPSAEFEEECDTLTAIFYSGYSRSSLNEHVKRIDSSSFNECSDANFEISFLSVDQSSGSDVQVLIH